MTFYRIADVAAIFNGKTPAKSDQRKSGHPVLKIKDVNRHGEFQAPFESFVEAAFAARYRNKWIEEGDILILNAAHHASHVASKTYLAEWSVTGSLATGEWLLIRSDLSKVLPSYLFYLLRTPRLRSVIRGEVKGGHLYPTDIGRIETPIPPVAEQRYIVDILDRAAGIRRLRRQAQETARQIIPALFVKMFGDPATNLMGWPVRPLGAVIAGLEGGKNLQAGSDGTASGGLRILKISAVTSGVFRPDEAKAAPTGYTPPPNHFVCKGDLLVTRANTAELVGATALVENDTMDILLPDKIWRIIWRSPSAVAPRFLLAWFKQSAIRTAMSRIATGTSASMRNISQGRLMTIGVMMPPLPLQERFARQAEAVERLARYQAEAMERATASLLSISTRLLG